jgi:hypothetical protein
MPAAGPFVLYDGEATSFDGRVATPERSDGRRRV